MPRTHSRHRRGQRTSQSPRTPSSLDYQMIPAGECALLVWLVVQHPLEPPPSYPPNRMASDLAVLDASISNSEHLQPLSTISSLASNSTVRHSESLGMRHDTVRHTESLGTRHDTVRHTESLGGDRAYSHSCSARDTESSQHDIEDSTLRIWSSARAGAR